MNVKKKIKDDLYKYVIVKILPAFSGFIFIYFLTKIFKTEEYSDYAFLMTSTLLFTQLVGGWVNNTVIFYYPDYLLSENVGRFKKNILNIQYFSILIILIPYIIVITTGHFNYIITILSSSLMFFQILYNFQISVLQAERNISKQILASIIQSIIQVVGVIVSYFYFNSGLISILIVLCIMYGIPFLYLFFNDEKGIYIPNININKKIVKEILKYGLPISIWIFSTQFYLNGDRILYNYLHIVTKVGSYAAFRDLSTGLSGFLTMPLLMATQPIIMQLIKGTLDTNMLENERIKKAAFYLGGNIKMLTTLFTMILIIFILNGNQILNLLVGEKYITDDIIIYLVIVSIFLTALTIYLQKGLESSNNTFYLAKNSFITAIISIILNLIFIPFYGVLAGAIITIVSQIIYGFLIYYNKKNIFKIRIEKLFIIEHLILIIITFLCKTIFNITNNFSFFTLTLTFSFVIICLLRHRKSLLYLFYDI